MQLHYAQNKIIFLVFFCVSIAQSQDWIWTRDPDKFNPSGIEITERLSDFQLVDWGGDDQLEMIVRNLGQLDYYEFDKNKLKWSKQNLNLPYLKLIVWQYAQGNWDTNVNFVIHDVDGDKDFDIITDSLYVYENIGSNAAPDWVVNPSYLKGKIEKVLIEGDSLVFNVNPQFIDFNNDGLIDLIGFDPRSQFGGSQRIRLYMFDGTYYRLYPQMDKLLKEWDYINTIHFIDFNNDKAIDYVDLGIRSPGWDPYWGFRFDNIRINQNIPDSLAWLQSPLQPIFNTSYIEELSTRYFNSTIQFVDFDKDTDLDLFLSASNRHIRAEKNLTFYSWHQDILDTTSYWGRLNVDSYAVPFLYSLAPTQPPMLLVSEDYISWIFAIDMFTAHFGRQRMFYDWDNLNHDSHYINDWYHSKFAEREEPNKLAWKRHLNLYKCFVDLNRDGVLDMVSSYLLGISSSLGDAKYKVELYYNDGTSADPIWRADTTFLAYFHDSSEKFSSVSLINLDADTSMEVITKRGEYYAAYQNLGTRETPNWIEDISLLSGIGDLNRYHHTFADLDRDGDIDLIFGNYDGTLSFFENQGDGFDYLWKKLPDVFDNIKVDSCAAPVFGDMDLDGDLDLILGDKKGFLYYYINDSTVPANQKTNETQPLTFYVTPNYPNPFNSSTCFKLSIPQTAFLDITIYNQLGEIVQILYQNHITEGEHIFQWDGTNQKGTIQPSGLYFCRIESEQYSHNLKMIFLQ